jgi:hypothetical protein
LRSAAAGSGSKTLFYLYSSDEALTHRARELGFDGVFTHKGNAERLLEQVNAALRLARLRSRGR